MAGRKDGKTGRGKRKEGVARRGQGGYSGRVNGKIEVAIVGGGPAGCTLAALLAQRGIRTLVFDDDKRPELLVGESLLPRVIKLMRRLGIEDRVK